jgi:adenine-specific DNA-methyltransferase
MAVEEPVPQYDGLTREQLIQILEKRERAKKLGLVWERNEIEADKAVDANFVACTLDLKLCERTAPWSNLVIEGDNFDALRWLRIGFSGRVGCIYIDPPYNTGNKDWVYNDHYFDSNDRYRHSTWLEFLFRRLSLARDLLSEEGVILISINDENRARLELLADEALPGMRIGTFVWRTKDSSNDAERNFSSVHEHVLVYARPVTNCPTKNTKIPMATFAAGIPQTP